MGHRLTKGICKLGNSAVDRIAGSADRESQKTTGLGFSRGLFKSPNLTGCFPPKPPARFLMHSDHRRDRKKQQEYRGNKREGLDGRRCEPVSYLQKMRQCARNGSGKNLNFQRCLAIHSSNAYDCHPLIRFFSVAILTIRFLDVCLRLFARAERAGSATELECTECCNKQDGMRFGKRNLLTLPEED